MVLADSFYYQPVQIDTINTRVNADLFAKEGDANGRGMVVQITENGIIKDTTGITLRLQWSHISVGTSGFTEFEVVDATKGLYKVKYPTSMLHRGRVEAFIRITDNGILSGTRNLLITVERMVGSDETIEAADDFSALQSALTKLSIWEETYRQELVSLGSQLAEKADIADLPSSAYTFKGSTTFATLPTTGNTLGDVYYTTDNIVNYAWNGTEWTPIGNGAFANGTVTNSKIANYSVTENKMAIPVVLGTPSKNLFDKTKVIKGKYPVAETGLLGTNADFSAYYAQVTEGETYTIHYPFIIVGYNEMGSYTGFIPDTNGTIVIPTGTKEICFGMYTSNLDIQQMEKGSSKTAYVPYGTKVARSNVKDIDNPYPYEILMPSTVYLVGGEKISIFYDSLIKHYQDLTKRACYIVVQQKLPSAYDIKGQQYNYKWEYTPTNADGAFDMEFRVVSTYNGSILASKVVTFIVADTTLVANHGRTANIVSVGDSFMDTDVETIIGKLYDNVTTKDGVNAVNLLGLHRASWANATVKDDSWAGYTYSWLYSSATGYLRGDRPFSHAIWDAGWGENEEFGWTTGQDYYDLTPTQISHGHTKNQFYNPATQLFDFSYYMSTYMSNKTVDGFISAFGLNDVGWVTVNEAKAIIAALVPKIQHIIDSVHTYDPTIKVLLYLIPKQKADNNTMGSYYTNFAHYERVNHNIELFNEMILDNFNGDANVYVVPSNVNFDSQNGYKTTTYTPDKFDGAVTETWSDDIHPNDKGALYIADTLYQAVYNLVLS